MRARTKVRCDNCWLRPEFCYCESVTNILTRTKITIIMHAAERYKTSSTARLLELLMPKCSVKLVGLKDQPFEQLLDVPDVQEGDYENLLLFPDPSAPVLDHGLIKSINRAIHLIVPDGTWSQAKRIAHRREKLGNFKTVRIAPAESEYQLRRNVHTGTLCTAEAVAYALGLIEGHKIESDILDVFRIMRQKILLGRSSRRASV